MNRLNRSLGFVSALVVVWSGGVLPSLSIQFDTSSQLLSKKPCTKPPKLPPGGMSELKYQNWLASDQFAFMPSLAEIQPSSKLYLSSLDDCGEGASAKVPNLNGKSRDEITQILTQYGFKSNNKPSPAGWETFKHEDKSKIDINWGDGRIIRTGKPIYGSDGRIINRGQRIDRNGYKIPRNIDHQYHPKESVDLKD